MTYYVRNSMSGCSCSGFGADITFNAASVWSDWMAGQACSGTNATACTYARRAVDKIRYALSQLGYGSNAMGAMWGEADRASYKAWAADAGVPSNGMPLKADLEVMQEQLAAGVTPGPETPKEYVEVGPGGTLVEAETAGLSTKIDKKWLILAAGVGGVALLGGTAYAISKRRKRAQAGAPAYAGAKA